MYLESASCGGHGTLEMLEVSRVLEENGILCAFCGVSALIYYGAGRDWDICVPSDLVEKAAAIFKSEERSNDYFPVAAQPIPWPGSLRHTYHRFRVRNLFLHFNIVPVDDIHLELAPDKIQRSRYGLPYPKLHVLIQSFLDTKDMVSLADVVDGSDVTDEWGQEHLNLEGETDVKWAAWKNKRIVACTSTILGGGVPSRPFKKRDLWKDVVSTKLGRCGWKRPHTLFKTRFRLIGSIDPWLEPDRICS
ncbi:hypothetical protein B0T21DRAFT_298824 [Apiosordaria backusii]|uniref:Uncharacterized protein n=1 Tax=Apiosordaria backusii TaxID=314023 RepID=A0AA40DNB3_9PEZI|nr:hypothetical protein B0T21DRAFT_298824 [Apiosordaria backusii]